MRKWIIAFGLLGLASAFTSWWRRHPRFGAAYVNRVVDPWLVRQGLIAESDGELGLIEHVGRVSGIVRRSPVHPVATERGFRIIVPLGDHSEWARNVLAAGHCRLQVGSMIYGLDEPALVAPSLIDGVPRPLGRAMDWLGFKFLLLHEYAASEGSFGTASGEADLTAEERIPSLEPVGAS